MNGKKHSRWLVLTSLALGLLCATGPCSLNSVTANQVGQIQERTAVSGVADTLFFFLDSLLVRISG